MTLAARAGTWLRVRTQARRVPASAVLLSGTAVVAVGAFWLVHDGLIDDAYITLSYARNVALHLHWGLIPDEVANTATSPLNVLALAAITAVVRDAVVAAGVLFVLAAVACARFLDALAADLGLSRAVPIVGTGLLLVNPLLLSTVGLEPYLTAALVAGLLRYAVAGRGAAFGLVAGLTVLARPDMAIVVAAVAVLLLRRGPLRALGAALAVTLPWYAFSWSVLGSVVPDTLVMKAGDAWGRLTFWNGPALYLAVDPRATALAAVPVLAAAAVLVGVLAARVAGPWARWQRTAIAAGLAGVAHFVGYGQLHTAPYHWYYAPLVVCATYCVAVAAGRTTRWPGLVGLGALAAVAAVSLASDLSSGWPWPRAPIGTNWASPAQYRAMGADLARIVGRQTVESPGEIGTLAYTCDCAIVDPFSDRGRVVAALRAAEAKAGPVAGALLRLNYAHLDLDQRPRPADWRLVYEAHRAPTGPLQWPGDDWTSGRGRFLLLRGGARP